MAVPHAFQFDQTIDVFRRAIEFVNRRIINRTEVIDQIFCALLTREHALIQSRTGAAKSLLAQQIFTMFSGAHVFMVQASKEQQPDTYFGGLDIEQLKQGRIIHNTRDSLVESEFGFIDEIFDANDYTLRALLTTLNERALVLGVQQVPARVHSVIAATNYLRVSEITEAILDRFVYKALFIPKKVGSVQYKIARNYIEHGGRAVEPTEKIPYDVLCRTSLVITGRDPVNAIRIPKDVIFFANSVVRHYESQRNRLLKEKPREQQQIKDFYISPRTYTKSLDMLRASAFLHGREEVVKEDVAKLWYLHTTVGLQEQKELFLKSYDTILHQLGAARAFEQITRMLDFQDLLDRLRAEPELLKQSITDLEGLPIRRTLKEWARETLGISDASVEHNRRLLEGYVKTFEPLTEEILDLRHAQEREIHELFHPIAHVWA
ncbi:MAG: AAA family ATPase [Ignavibacteriae bacterium]|nr:AAA family ATPase [Ignavibacteriota bacterium]